MRGFPPPPPAFQQRKHKILEQLSTPDADYNDASPKGSVDVGIRDLIDKINSLDGFVTTSSCAGRVSVFVEGRKSGEKNVVDNEEDASGMASNNLAGVGGKGGGGKWLFVSHDPVDVGGEGENGDVEKLLGLKSGDKESTQERLLESDAARLIHFKFEPMILHVLTASPEHAQLLLRCGLQAGFRESGAINLTSARDEPVTPIVAIRSMGLALESIIGVQVGDDIQPTVSSSYLQDFLRISGERFVENTKRIGRIRTGILEATSAPTKKDGTKWEDAASRRERKKAEGLRRKAELQAQEQQGNAAVENEALDLPLKTGFT
ncbi:methyltransferase TYW3-domain-containing protein [Pseudomassariella vexata]|uniref:tRNA(Phe) 7-[(3-amino-3-carboxypropyl)-4-demethylwyosine(37)-N(4)]-methyltransferase n=1 Tax=Pseudomassariella vexata TaxID=1141098 RepID=A0A1Y2E8T9_9PEZI|nr:methyltransferase TYW3-domain-containing protein [Pseudomassariella vexata]ORY67285.1 methyltransferase TYW3-domain-containing protein [Pseudomassariella vexata]